VQRIFNINHIRVITDNIERLLLYEKLIREVIETFVLKYSIFITSFNVRAYVIKVYHRQKVTNGFYSPYINAKAV
jgi:hypothetical protein